MFQTGKEIPQLLEGGLLHKAWVHLRLGIAWSIRPFLHFPREALTRVDHRLLKEPRDLRRRNHADHPVKLAPLKLSLLVAAVAERVEILVIIVPRVRVPAVISMMDVQGLVLRPAPGTSPRRTLKHLQTLPLPPRIEEFLCIGG